MNNLERILNFKRSDRIQKFRGLIFYLYYINNMDKANIIVFTDDEGNVELEIYKNNSSSWLSFTLLEKHIDICYINDVMQEWKEYNIPYNLEIINKTLDLIRKE